MRAGGGRAGAGAVTAILEVAGVSKRFGGLKAVADVSFEVAAGSVVGLIGPNGAGKTTTFNLITGNHRWTRVRSGSRGRSITGLRPHRIVALGIARTFQNIRLFPQLTAVENVPWPAATAGPGPACWRPCCGSPLARCARSGTRWRGCVDRAGVRGALGAGAGAGAEPLPRRPAAAGDRPGAGQRSAPAGAGRAGRRHERAGDRRAGRPHRPDPRTAASPCCSSSTT